jgi:hypothetical protein
MKKEISNSPVPFVFIVGQVEHIEIIGRMPGWTYPTLAKQNQSNTKQTDMLSHNTVSKQTNQPSKRESIIKI